MSNGPTTVPRAQPTSLAVARQALDAAEQEVATRNDRYLRAAAALENTRKHAARAVATQVNQQVQRLVLGCATWRIAWSGRSPTARPTPRCTRGCR